MGRGKRIKYLLTVKGMTARQLAEKAGCTEVTMSRYINETRIPKVTDMARIADALGTTIDYLETGKTERRKLMVEEIKDRTCIEAYDEYSGTDIIFAVDRPYGKEALKVLSEAMDDFLETEPGGTVGDYLCRRMDEQIGAICYQPFYADTIF